MTRETKVGLVIAAAFIGLVGVVVASKWSRGDASGEQEEPNANPVAAKGEPKKDAAAKKPPTVVPASSPSPNSAHPRSTIVFGDPPPASNGFEPNKLTLSPSLPPVGNDDKINEALQRIAQNSTEAAPKPAAAPMPKSDVSVPMVDFKPQVDPTPPSNVLDPKIVGKPSDEKPGVTPPTIDIPLLQSAPAIEQKKDAPGIPAPPGLTAQGIDPPAVSLPGPIGKPEAQPIPPLEKKDPVAPPPPVKKDDTPPVKKDEPPPVKVPPIGILPGEIAKPSLTPAVVPPNGDLPKPPVIPSPNVNDGANLPVAPPIVLGGQKNLPDVKDWKTDIDVVRQGESSFAALSLRMYGGDKYADALLAYNRAHSGAVKNGSAFQYNPPLLNPGQQVLKPPVAVLESEYRDKIRTAGAVPTIGGVAPAIKLATPMPLAQAGVSPPATLSGRVYTVQSPNGESILDIAERTLGSHRDWHRIATLNPQYQPQFRIPAGTQLKLP